MQDIKTRITIMNVILKTHCDFKYDTEHPRSGTFLGSVDILNLVQTSVVVYGAIL